MNQPPSIVREFDIEEISSLQLTTLSGDIELIGQEENKIRVEVFFAVRGLDSLYFDRDYLPELEEDRYILKVKKSAKHLEIFGKPNYSNPFNWFNYIIISFRVYAPFSISSQLKTWGGNISVKNIAGNQEFMTWGGNLFIERAGGKLNGNTMGGKIEIMNSDASIEVKTWGGKVILANNQGEINARTLGGNISIKNQKGEVHASTAGGKIICDGLKGTLKCSTSGGKIRLYNIDGNVGASTLGGSIEAEIKSIKDYLWLDNSGGRLNAVLPLNQGLNLDIFGYKINMPPIANFEGLKTQKEIYGKLNGGGANVKIKINGKINIINSIPKEVETPEFQSQKPQKTVEKPVSKPVLPKEKISKFGFNTFVIGLFFCLILCYGLSSITYFTLEIFNPLDRLAPIYKGVFLSNIANGLASFIAVNLFIKTIDFRIYSTWLKYFLLLILTLGFVSIFQVFVGIVYWQHLSDEVLGRRTNNFGYYYSILPLFVSCAYYFYLKQNQQITRKISEQEYQLLNLEKLKTKSDLSALQARINPHFLYNSLNSIASLVHTDPDKAEEMTILLSKLFRYTTDRNNEDFNSISDELDIVRTYLSVEQVRFGDRLKFSTDLENGLENFQIPRLLLQPLVENAIKHGISKSSVEEKIEIKIFRENENIILLVHDSGQPFPTEMTSGYGLRSVQEKLRLIYGEKASLEIRNDENYKAVVIKLATIG